MGFDQFTDSARRTMGLARQAAVRYEHDYIGTEHILFGLLRLPHEDFADFLSRCGGDPERAMGDLRAAVAAGTAADAPVRLPFTSMAKKTLEETLSCASRLDHDWIGVEHLLVGLLSASGGTAAAVLAEQGLTAEKVEMELRLRHPPAERPDLDAKEQKLAWRVRTFYLVLGFLGVSMGAAVLLWWAYNTFIERQPGFRPGFTLGLWVTVLGISTVWLRRAWTGRERGAGEESP